MNSRPNSITIHKTKHSIANSVRILRSEHRRTSRSITIVIVEGEVVDPLIYQSLFDDVRCHIETSHGKENAIGAIAILIKENFPGVIAIVDDDFDTVNGTKIQSENIISTDAHDIENLIIKSPALDKFLLNLLPQDKRKYQAEFTKDMRETIVSLCFPLGLIRWYFNKQNLNADFTSINFRKFIDVRKRKINIGSAIIDVLSKNRDTGVQDIDILSHVEINLKENKNKWWHICQGHYLVKILYFLLPVMLERYLPKEQTYRQKFFTSINAMIECENTITKLIAMCYEKSYFEKTVMHSRIVDWEKRNSPYCIL